MASEERDRLLGRPVVPPGPSGPLEGQLDLWEAAKAGDLSRVEELLSSGQCKATDRDSQGITALHWAAIHRHLNVVTLLLDRGADPNAKGGDLMATPVMWAARSGIVEVVALLCQRGGDPKLVDSQGYNALHLAAHGAHYFVILYLVMCGGMDLDSLDQMGRTALMWIAYMGISQECLDLVLKLNPDVNRQDSTGLSALHWAVCTSHFSMAQSLLKAGADVRLRDQAGKTPEQWAKEINKEEAWRDVVAKATEKQIKGTLTPNAVRLVLFVLPFAVLPLGIFAFAVLPWYFGILGTAGLMWGTMTLVTSLLGRNAHKDIIKTPFPTAIFQASGYYVVFTWLFRLLPNTSLLLSMAFISLWSTAMYQLYRCILGDPGYVPLCPTANERKRVIGALAVEGRLNEGSFCATCDIRRPLRSKHCKICNRCVARFDHHCPWTYCCVGTLNHLRFVIFLICFVSCVILFDILTIEYYSSLQYPINHPIPTYFSCSFPTAFCNMLATDSWTFLIATWAGLQTLWCGPLCLYQIYYAVANTTTYESIKAPSRYPHDRGFVQNVVEFLSETQGPKWFTTFASGGWDAPRDRSIDLV
ncbi:ankyrin repeat-containing domain protein [Hyaloraphidium curvatum]|nr:ankyrin repeat-containing domain protein [Hyaloraphidium curvatum]